MKKYFLLMILPFFYELFSAPVGNPLNPDIIEEGFFISSAAYMNFRVGFEGNFVSDAKMDKINNEGKIDNFKMDVNSGSLTINLQNRIDLFGVIGASRIRSDYRFSNNLVMQRIELESNYRPYYAGGGKAILYQWGNTTLDIGSRYSTTRPSLSFVTLNGAPQEKAESKISFRDWQIDMGLAHKIDIFIPYVGIKYSKEKAKFKGFQFPISDDGSEFLIMKNREKFGVYAGCSLSNKKYFMLTLEARFLDEEAVSIFGDLKF